MRKITEDPSPYQNVENMTLQELLKNINTEDTKLPLAVYKVIPQIMKVVQFSLKNIKKGGRIFYVGAGTSGRLGVLDASEIYPTYGVRGLFMGIIAGGDGALRNSIEQAEDDTIQCWKDLKAFDISDKDILIGIAAGGTTPYVIGGMLDAKKHGVITGCITCNKKTKLASIVDYPIEVIVGPEFITGSTRMKSGTAQKMILNMISTAIMVRLGKVKGNKMVDMRLNNKKLVHRGINMIIDELDICEKEAEKLLLKNGSVREVLDNYRNEK